MDVIFVKQALILKEAKYVYEKLMSKDSMDSLYMIDIIQRLGIEHYFKEEIETALQKQHLILRNHLSDFVNSHELHEIALTFRLLRQGGHYVNADIFDSFKCERRKFRENYGQDVKSLIAMYEASQLSIEGEDSLDDAGYLCCELLRIWQSNNQDHGEAIYVANTLQHPLHYGLTRFMDKMLFLNDFKAKNEWSCLEELATINSCILRFMNKSEIIEVSGWWKDLGLAKEVNFGGYEPLKWYMWSMACFTDPSFSDQRVELTKPISLIYIIDDIFDVYGTLDQLDLFTDAVNRWELDGTEQLPDFMRNCLSALYDITNDFAQNVYKKHGLNTIDTLKKLWGQLLKAFLKEAHWLNSTHMPKAEEYLSNGIVSTGVPVVLIHAFFLMDQCITEETVAMMDDSLPSIIYSVAKILRLSDDWEGSKSEDQNGVDGSYIDYYMNEHQHISVEEAQRHVAHLISSEWKRLNGQILETPNPFPSLFTNFCLNAARMVPLMYHYRTNPSLSNLHELVKSLVNVVEGPM